MIPSFYSRCEISNLAPWPTKFISVFWSIWGFLFDWCKTRGSREKLEALRDKIVTEALMLIGVVYQKDEKMKPNESPYLVVDSSRRDRRGAPIMF